jgi:5-methylcytosine-specific restriction enzyme subunit McrC
MRQLSLLEYRTEAAVPLTSDERDLLQVLTPSISLTPTRGLDGHYDLTPSSTIGAIELPTLAIEIRPKIPLDRVFFLISYALDPKAWRDSTFAYAASPTLLEAMIPPFITSVASALHRGVLQGYLSQEDSLLTVRGRIRFDEQLRRRYGRYPPVEVRYDEFTEDIDPNRLIKAAISRLGRLRIRSRPARISLRRFDQALERVRLVDYDARRLPDISYSRLNQHYQAAVALAKLILRATTLELQHGSHRGAAFLIDMNTVFENFVVVALREALKLTDHALPQGARNHKLWLDQHRRIRLRPDLSWWEAGRCVFVGDVKYKRVQVAQIEHPDLYQLLAYTIATQLPGGMLIYAADEAIPVDHQIPLAGKHLRVATLDVHDQPDDILTRVRQLARHVHDLRRQTLDTNQAPLAA